MHSRRKQACLKQHRGFKIPRFRRSGSGFRIDHQIGASARPRYGIGILAEDEVLVVRAAVGDLVRGDGRGCAQ